MGNTSFQSLSTQDRRDALQVAASQSGKGAHLLEKDIWVVQTLRALTETPFSEHLTFKGGTSLAKAYQAIQRFSEDLDITYDIRAIVPDLISGSAEEVLPANRSQERRWTREIRTRLKEWVRSRALPAIEAGLAREGLSAQVHAEKDVIYIGYTPLFSDYGFVRPEVMVEFGARSTGEPRQTCLAKCDAAAHIPQVAFPSARPFVMLPERTFWEKATAAHVFCQQERRRGERLSRHWHDLVRLDDAGYCESALSARRIAFSVARHKAIFFGAKDAAGSWIDFEAAVSGALQLVPDGQAHNALADDYNRMLSDGMLLDDKERFDTVMERCADIQDRANSA